MDFRRPLSFVFLFLFQIALASHLFAQSAGKGSIKITGSVRGPIYLCGSRKCPAYDSGKIKVTVNGYTVAVSYSKVSGQNTASSLAAALTNALNRSASPVTAERSNTTIVLSSKAKGAGTNYSLSAGVSRDTRFANPSFYATRSGSRLSGGTNYYTAPVGTLASQLGNNTSACSAPGDPAGNLPHCFDWFRGNNTNPLNLLAQTLRVNTTAGHVSKVDLHELMGAGWTGSIICEYQPWFGLGSHISVGYNENSAATIAAQNDAMLARGCDIVWVDWYGSTSPNQAFNLATSNQMFANLKARNGYPLKFAVLEDKDGLKYSCPISGKSREYTIPCLINAMIKDMDYIHANYAQNPVYWTDGGRPVIGSFVTQSQWPVLTKADWDTIWNAVKAHTDTYAVPFKYVLQYGSFTAEPYDNGRYAWVKPAAWDPIAQLWWGSNTSSTPTFLDAFYSGAKAHPQKLSIGPIFKGFDDNNASWSGNRVTAQQCGRVLMNSVKEARKYFTGSNPQIPYMQVVTWNDYEEGTEVESGIDNCYDVSALLVGNTLSWTLLPGDLLYASTSTIHHFGVYFADSAGKLYLAKGDLPVTTRSLDLSTLVPHGTWTVYVEMVGQPLIINRMSNPLTYIKN